MAIDDDSPQVNDIDEFEVRHYPQYLEDMWKWERLFNMACHDRDIWQQQCASLETVVQRQREKIRELLGYERTVVIDCDFTEEELENLKLRPGCIIPISAFRPAEEAESETQGIGEATRNEGSDSGETRPSGDSGRPK
jgi:hypothetical protein